MSTQKQEFKSLRMKRTHKLCHCVMREGFQEKGGVCGLGGWVACPNEDMGKRRNGKHMTQ